MRINGSIDINKAILDPDSVFSMPDEVVKCAELTQKQKIDVLRLWYYDVAEAAVATEEGMPDGENDLMQQIVQALDHLGTSIGGDHVGPTKQHGLSSPSDELE